MNCMLWRSVIWISILIGVIAGCSDSESNHTAAKDESKRVEKIATPIKEKGQRPEEVLLAYLNAEIEAALTGGKSRHTYALLSERDKKVTTEEEYLLVKEGIDVSQELMKACTSKIAYKTKNTSIEDGVATVVVELSAPSIPPSLRNLMLGEISPESEQKLIAFLTSPNLPKEKSESSYTLLKEETGWRVFLDLATKKRINALIVEAEKLAPSLDMLGPIDGSVLESMKENLLLAKEKYKQMLGLDDDEFGVCQATCRIFS